MYGGKFKIGDAVMYRGRETFITNIECTDGEDKYGQPVKEAPLKHKDRYVFDLANGHWAYGYQIDIVPSKSY